MENTTGASTMISVAAYLSGIPPNNRNLEKPLLIKNFIEGVNKSGDKGTVVETRTLVPADVALIQGFVHANSKNAPHLMLRKQVFETQLAENKRCIIADSNLFLYADPGNTKKYLRYSYDGVFPNTGEYCNSTPDPARWEKIQKDLDISLKPWSFKGKYFLICCQREGGWSMGGTGVIPWLINTITELRRHTTTPIKVRFHPGDKKKKDHIARLRRLRIPDTEISVEPDIRNDFMKAKAVVTYNSSPGVAAAIEGKPVVVLDPQRSQAAPVAHHALRDLKNLKEFDREFWIQQIAQMHWNLTELKSGEAWTHMKQWATLKENK
jgi:hypothetical protein